jgi:phospholipase/carboxylesterase
MSLSRQKIGSLECLLINPLNGKPPKAAVVLCHGFGAPGQDLVPIGTELSRRSDGSDKAIYIFPAAPLELDPTFDGRAWWMIDVARLQYLMAIGETRQMRHVDPPELADCRQHIMEILDWARKRFSLSSEQLVLGGFSQGAMLATDVALHSTDCLGGLIIWSGALICEQKWQKAAAASRPLRVVQTHGNEDMILSLEGAKDLQRLLTLNRHEVHFLEFDGPHTIPREGIDLAAELIKSAIDPSASLKARL